MKRPYKIFVFIVCSLMCVLSCLSTFATSAERARTYSEQKAPYSSFTELSEYEIGLIESAVEATAGGESYAVRVALAATLLNRLSSPLYPDSLPKLIRGTAFLSPKSAAPSDKTSQAVLAALLGVSPCARATHAMRLGEKEEVPEWAVSYVRIDGWLFWEE